MTRRGIFEPCLCGDPECPRCFPGAFEHEEEGFDETLADEERQERRRAREERATHTEDK